MSNQKLVPCHDCGAELMPETTEGAHYGKVSPYPIWSHQLTVDFQIVGPLQVLCPNCGRDVGDLLTQVINNHANLVREVFGGSEDYYEQVRGFITTVRSALESLPTNDSPMQFSEVLRQRFGLNGEKAMTYAAIAKSSSRSLERARQKVQGGLRRLRHPSRGRYLRGARPRVVLYEPEVPSLPAFQTIPSDNDEEERELGELGKALREALRDLEDEED